jgi:hypothetical protein
MQHKVIAIRAGRRESEAATTLTSLESVILFSLLGLVVSAVLLLMCSAETIATINAASMLM